MLTSFGWPFQLALLAALCAARVASAQPIIAQEGTAEAAGKEAGPETGNEPGTTPEANAESAVATQLQNPIANLTTVPLQNNFDFGQGVDDEFGYVLNIQPVIPIPFGPHFKVLSRSILPIIDQPALAPGMGRAFGLGDLTQSFFFSPAANGGFIWGIGPVFSLPTATEDVLGTGKWGIGPTGVALWQEHGWTIGALVNHIWSFAGPEDRSDVSTTFLQPFLSYTLPIALSFTLQTETTYDWEREQWTIPIALGLAQVVRLGKLPVSLGLFGRVWAAGPESAPDWGIRVPITFVLPAISGT